MLDSHDENYESIDFIWTQWMKQKIIEKLPTELDKQPITITYNKIEDNFNLSDKKDLFTNLDNYYKNNGEEY